ncbi:MAG: Trm112 family protein [Thermoplasmata archaeon]|nr:MAG: Trm112 family protein [Thermoplasmata archaeon]
MRIDLMDILCCPVCKGELELKVDKKEGDDILEGKLICHKCNVKYPIQEGIPDLLPRNI